MAAGLGVLLAGWLEAKSGSIGHAYPSWASSVPSPSPALWGAACKVFWGCMPGHLLGGDWDKRCQGGQWHCPQRQGRDREAERRVPVGGWRVAGGGRSHTN